MPLQFQEKVDSVASERDEFQKVNDRLVQKVAELKNKCSTTCDSRDQSGK